MRFDRIGTSLEQRAKILGAIREAGVENFVTITGDLHSFGTGRLKADFDESGYTESQQVILRALKTYGMLLSDGGQVPLTFADDTTSTAKWAELGIDSHTFDLIGVDDFEVVDLGPDIELTYDCVRN